MAVAAACGGGSPERSADGGGRPASDAALAAGAPNANADSGASRTVVFVGTSLTAGLGLDPEDAYPSLIARKIDSAGLGFRVVNAGVSGETSAGLLRRLDWLLRGPAAVVVVETGANDGLRGVDVDSMRANIRAILDRVRTAKPEARVLLVQMEALPNFGPRYTVRFREVFPALARETGVMLAPFLLEGVAGEPRLNQPDGIHPNEEGERIVAENVWRALRPVLEELTPARTTGGP